MSKGIYLIRHGQTPPNIECEALGTSESILTEEGVQEIKDLARYLKVRGVYPQRIYTSPLIRANQTAEIFQADLGGAVEISPLLKEINYGVYEGQGKVVLREIEYGYATEKMREGQAESVRNVETRVTTFLSDILQIEETTIFVVTHAFVASVFTQILMGVERSFQNIQPLATGDYNFFQIEKGGDKDGPTVLAIQRNCLKERLEI